MQRVLRSKSLVSFHNRTEKGASVLPLASTAGRHAPLVSSMCSGLLYTQSRKNALFNL